jgi:hypothetical protein
MVYVPQKGGVLRRMAVEGGEETDYVRDLWGASPGTSQASFLFFVTAKDVYY